MNKSFLEQVRLMLDCLPTVMKDEAFALKGGTAINFFVRDMPRLSVDIDLTYLPIEPRESSLKAISNALDRSGTAIRRLSNTVEKIRPAGSKHIHKLLVRTSKAQVKIEPNTIIRGTVFPAKDLPLVSKAQEAFETAFNFSCLDEDELYAGKICAALDRQHPRDLFDMKDFFSFRNLTERLGQALVIYIASSPRPMHELLSPKPQDISKAFAAEFQGMSAKPVSLDELLEARANLFKAVTNCLPATGKEFLLTLKSAEPRWELIDYVDAKSLPAIEWKLRNLGNLDKAKRSSQLSKLERALK
jgi:hypothetical protein